MNEYLITGGTGSLGKAIIKELISRDSYSGIRIYSRDELKQYNLKKELSMHENISFLIGDVRDYQRLERACIGVDYVVNAAAMKQVGSCEYNPEEAIKTNIDGTRNVMNAAINTRVKKVMHISTDKAVSPINLYGMTKGVAEKLMIHGNVYSGENGTKFSCCRYGNVLGSRGSIVPLFKEQAKTGTITITHEEMTRFWITLDQVANFILSNINGMTGGEIFIPKMPSCHVKDIARWISPGCELKNIGIRKGEKLHEDLISQEETRQMMDLDNMYLIQDELDVAPLNWTYNSLDNEYKLTEEAFKRWYTTLI